MLHVVQTKNGTRATDIIAMLRWAEANLDGRILGIGGRGRELFDIRITQEISVYETYESIQKNARMSPFMFGLLSESDFTKISAASPAKIKAVETAMVEPERITCYLCADLRDCHGVNFDDDAIRGAIVFSINQGFEGQICDAVAEYLRISPSGSVARRR